MGPFTFSLLPLKRGRRTQKDACPLLLCLLLCDAGAAFNPDNDGGAITSKAGPVLSKYGISMDQSSIDTAASTLDKNLPNQKPTDLVLAGTTSVQAPDGSNPGHQLLLTGTSGDLHIQTDSGTLTVFSGTFTSNDGYRGNSTTPESWNAGPTYNIHHGK